MKYRKLIVGVAAFVLMVCLVLPAYAAGGFVGSSRSDVYHVPDCYHVDEIAPGNLIWWHTLEDASRYRRPCNDCRPDRYGRDFYYGNTSRWISDNPRIQLGFEEEYDAGLDEGYDRGYNRGYTDGYYEGLDDGYDEGYDVGWADGHKEGWNDGETAGYEAGSADGYESGYQAAVAECQAKMDALKATHAEEIKDKQWESVGATAATVGILGFVLFWIKEGIASRRAIDGVREKQKEHTMKNNSTTVLDTKPKPPTASASLPIQEQRSESGPKPEPRNGPLSGVIHEFWHKNGVLYVTFTSGGTLCYQNVPLYVYLHMRSAESAEDYLRDQVTGIYKCIPFEF